MDLHSMDFGDRLKYIRELNNVSQKQLASLTGISNQTISNWERNYTKSISLDDLRLLALHLNCKVGDFLPELDERSIDYKKDIDIEQHFISIINSFKDEHFIFRGKHVDNETLEIVSELLNSILNILKIRIKNYTK